MRPRLLNYMKTWRNCTFLDGAGPHCYQNGVPDHRPSARDSDTRHFSPPAHSPRRASLPSRSYQTTTGVTAIRCPDRSAGNTPASQAHAANTSPRDYRANDLSRTDRGLIVHKDDRPTSTRQTAAADVIPSPQGAPELHNPRRTPATPFQPEIMPAAYVVGSFHRRLRSPDTTTARWLSLISPRYNTWRCTTLPPLQRLLSTMFQ